MKPLADIVEERFRQVVKWGVQSLKDGTRMWPWADAAALRNRRHEYAVADALGELTWRAVLAEEVAEAFNESDPAALRSELVQVAAVAVAWIEDLDRRST